MSHIKKKKLLKRTLGLSTKLQEFMNEVGLDAAGLSRVLDRSGAEAVTGWLTDDQSVPDWVDLILMRRYAAKMRRSYDFYRFADQLSTTALRVRVRDRPGFILDLAALVYEFHGSVRRLEASAVDGVGEVVLYVEHPHSAEALEQAIRETRGVEKVEPITEAHLSS